MTRKHSHTPALQRLRCPILLSWALVCLALSAAQTHAQSIYTPYAFTNFAGMPNGGPGTNDGTGIAARFGSANNGGPAGVAVDNAGNIYVADTGNFTIRKITPAGVVTTFAGAPGQFGTADGPGATARFWYPAGLAVDSAGNLYVADSANNTIRKITPNGLVTTLAGSAPETGTNDGTGSAARFNGPNSVAVDSAGNVYVADYGNNTIRQITPDGTVTTLAGTAGQGGFQDGNGTAAQFYSPAGVAVDSANNVYVADSYYNTIRKVTPAGDVTTFAGTASVLGFGCGGSADGIGSAAQFCDPTSVAVDSMGNVYVADTHNFTIRKITPDGAVTTLAGVAGQYGSADGPGSAARFGGYYCCFFICVPDGGPGGVAVDSAGNLYLADTTNDTIRKVAPDGFVTLLAGSPPYGSDDGIGNSAQFDGPAGITVDGAGNIFVADTYNSTIRNITPNALVTTLAGHPWPVNHFGTDCGVAADGLGSSAGFCFPNGVAADRSGALYVADSGNNTIRQITAGGIVTTLAGCATCLPGSADGTNSAARFDQPSGVGVDRSGNLYVADTYNSTVRGLTLIGTNWVVTTIAGSPGQNGANDGVGSAARFYRPGGVAVDDTGNVYVADTGNHTVRKLTPNGVVTTLAGSPGLQGSSDGIGHQARFSSPSGVAVDSAGNVFVADSENNRIRRITSAGMVTTLAGAATNGSADGIGNGAGFWDPTGVALDHTGNLYVADNYNNRITKGTPVLQFDRAAGVSISNGLIYAQVIGPPGDNFVLETSVNLQTWTPVQTNSLAAIGLSISVPLGFSSHQFLRAGLAP